MDTINDLIRKNYTELTIGQKAVAEFILKDPQQIAIQTAKEIGVLSGTSETTVIRFCLAIGFAGYSSMQEAVRTSMYVPKQPDNPLRQLGELPELSADQHELPRLILEQDMGFMAKTMEGLDALVLAKAIECILTSHKIVIVGLRAAFAPAHWLAHTLNIVKGNTTLYRGEMDDANYLISEMNKESLVIAFSFPRYAMETIQFVQAAKDKSAKILAISDAELSPLGQKADVFIKVAAPLPVSLKGMPIIFSLLNVLVGSLIAKDHVNIQNRIETYNAEGNYSYSFYHEDK